MSSYYAIVPATVRYDKKLIPSAKLLYGEITALSNEKGFCWASNQYFADLYEVSIVTVSKWVKNLADNEHISISLEVSANGTERKIAIAEVGVKEKFKGGIKESLRGALTKVKEGHKEKFKHNNTVNNTTNTTSDTDELLFKSERFKASWEEWLKYRKERKVPKYTETGLKKTFKDLASLCGGEEDVAIKIIDQSISKNWQGLFALKQQFGNPSATGNKYENDRQNQLAAFKPVME